MITEQPKPIEQTVFATGDRNGAQVRVRRLGQRQYRMRERITAQHPNDSVIGLLTIRTHPRIYGAEGLGQPISDARVVVQYLTGQHANHQLVRHASGPNAYE